MTLWGDGKKRREFIFLKDLVAIVFRLTVHGYSGVLNIVSGKSFTFADAIEAVSCLAPATLQVDSRARTKRKVDYGFRNDALMRLFPDTAFTGLEEGIRQTFEAECYREFSKTEGNM